MFNLFTQIFGTGQQPPQVEEATPDIKGAVFRVTGIPLTATVQGLNTVLSSEFSSENIAVDASQTTICPSCHDKKTQTALINFIPYSPRALRRLPNNDTYQIPFSGTDISIDKGFYALTQLYNTTGEIKADIVAVCGLNGHAYGSWAGMDQRDQRKMWLRHFLREDLPQCRTMIYGYNSEFTSSSTHMIPDYTDTFLEELKKARQSKDEINRPIVFIGHSFGGIIIAQAIVKAKDHDKIHGSLFSSTRATIFFGTPHHGLVVDDILAMLGKGAPREALVKSIASGSRGLEGELRRFINYSTINNLKIVSFKEIGQTRKLKQGPDGKWSRSGDYFTAVESGSSVLQLPDTIEESLAVEGDHSTMVKFKHKGHSSYTSVVRHLENFTLDIELEKRCITAYSAVKDRSAQELERILRNPAVDVNKDLRHEGNTTTLLHMAVDNGDEATVSVLLEHGADVYRTDAKGNTALHLAALGGHEKVVEVLLKSGADIAVTAIDENGFTGLHLAAASGHVQLVEIFLKNGADIAARGNDGDTPLHAAAWHGCEKTTGVLLKSGASITTTGNTGGTALHFAAHQGHEKVIKMLLEKGLETETADNAGNTVLHFAAQGGYEKVLGVLLERGAKVTATNKLGNTALHLAAHHGHQEVVKILLKHRAEIEATGDNGYTPLHCAAWHGHGAVVDVLLEHEANIAVPVMDESGLTALHLAALGGYEEVAEVLLKAGADIGATERYGYTALHLAAKGGYEKAVEVLLENGADTEVVMAEYMYTALHLAAQGGHEGVVEVLLGKKADIEATDKDRYTALHLAAWSGCEMVVDVLLKHGADIAANDGFKNTALSLAVQGGHKRVVELLKRGHRGNSSR